MATSALQGLNILCHSLAIEDQAVDRCHRIGQTQPVTVVKFIVRLCPFQLMDMLVLKILLRSATDWPYDRGSYPSDPESQAGNRLGQHVEGWGRRAVGRAKECVPCFSVGVARWSADTRAALADLEMMFDD